MQQQPGMAHMAYMGQFVDIPTSIPHCALYAIMSITELWLDVHRYIGAGVESWRILFDSVPAVTKLCIVAKAFWGPPQLTCVEALGGAEDVLPSCRNLRELYFIHSGGFTEELLPAVQLMKVLRESAGYPTPRIVIGAHAPLYLDENYVKDVETELGGEVIVGMQHLSFDWAPFSQRTMYRQQYGSFELSGNSPGMWAEHLSTARNSRGLSPFDLPFNFH